MFTIDQNTLFCMKPDPIPDSYNHVYLGGQWPIINIASSYDDGPISSIDGYRVPPTCIKYPDWDTCFRSDNYITVPSEYTAELWVKYESTSLSGTPLYVAYDANNVWSVGWEFTSNSNKISQQINNQIIEYDTSGLLSLNNWHHLVFQFWQDSTNNYFEFFIDGDKLPQVIEPRLEMIAGSIFFRVAWSYKYGDTKRTLRANQGSLDKFAFHNLKRYDNSFIIPEEIQNRYQLLL